jgi:hypothetical protein
MAEGPKTLFEFAHKALHRQLHHGLHDYASQGFFKRETDVLRQTTAPGGHPERYGDDVIMDQLEAMGKPRQWGQTRAMTTWLAARRAGLPEESVPMLTDAEMAKVDAVYKPHMQQYVDEMERAKQYMDSVDLNPPDSMQTGQGVEKGSQPGAGTYAFDNLPGLKELRKRIRLAKFDERKERSELYADVLSLINSYYPHGGAAWRKTAELLPRGGRQESGGSYLPAVIIFSALKRMLGDDRMRTNGLMLIQRIAKLSGSLTQDYRPVLQGLSKELGFQLDIEGASKGAWDNIVVTDEGGIAVKPSKEQKGSGVSRTPPVRMAQVFTPGTEGVMFTQRAMKQRQREKAHRGASAEQQILAGTGVLPPQPGYHYMSTGELMRDPV